MCQLGNDEVLDISSKEPNLQRTLTGAQTKKASHTGSTFRLGKATNQFKNCTRSVSHQWNPEELPTSTAKILFPKIKFNCKPSAPRLEKAIFKWICIQNNKGITNKGGLFIIYAKKLLQKNNNNFPDAPKIFLKF